MSQIALPLTLRTSADPGRIVIGNANRTAHEALGMPQDWPFRTAVLTGPSRSGKTLFRRWAEGRGLQVVDGADRVGEIGKASCRERVWQYVSFLVVAVSLK